MISFDLKCAHGHVFEAWFRSTEGFDTQNEASQIECPLCGSDEIAKAVMAPAVAAKGNRRTKPEAVQQMATTDGPPNEEQIKAMLGALAEAQAKALETSEWVGDKFAEEARAMHYGETEHRAVHGTADAREARAMIEEGLSVAPLIVPVAPPDRTH